MWFYHYCFIKHELFTALQQQFFFLFNQPHPSLDDDKDWVKYYHIIYAVRPSHQIWMIGQLCRSSIHSHHRETRPGRSWVKTGPSWKIASSCLIIIADKAQGPGSLHASFSLWELQVEALGTGKWKTAYPLSPTWVTVSPSGTHLVSESLGILVCFFPVISIHFVLQRSLERRMLQNKCD